MTLKNIEYGWNVTVEKHKHGKRKLFAKWKMLKL